MREKKLWMCLVVVLTCTIAYGQRASIRHVKGIRSVDAGYGISKYGSLFHAGYVMYFSNRLYGKGQLFYESTENEEGLKLSSIGADIYASYNFTTIKEIVFFNLNGGLTVANDAPRGNVEGNLKLPSQIKYGVLGGVDTEIFLSDKFVIVLTYNQKLLTKKDSYGQTRWYGQVGLRYNF